MLLDTSFLIDLMNGDEDAVDTARELESELVQQRLSAMTLFELYYGAARSNQSESEREKIENVLFFSDLDGSVEEWRLPRLTTAVSSSVRNTLTAVIAADETTLPELTEQLDASKSTITRHIEELVSSGAVESWREGKVKHVRPTLTGRLLVE